ncbi:Helix-turn-helix domain-containing protein [Lentzea xinjiangensis]|uniref:Helix-turn-helix domain-containing protein n=1 Tax=Lentzea xinjiangensis TaxID=402600 RepID=A0A1H9W669_9PSEU|nr:helix-turn-helix transcriptional regulator [Lentzea xinjiangensis]SES28963.1 Helix-turn-helix domain-containing protein [Lentzea xinjiangensis]
MARPPDIQRILDELGGHLRECRLKAKISGAEAGRRAGISQSKVAKIENGTLWAQQADLYHLADALRMDRTATERLRTLMSQLQDASDTIETPASRVRRDPETQQALEELCAVIRQHRDKAGMTRVEAGRRTGIGRKRIEYIENGTRRPPTEDEVGKLAGALGMDPVVTERALEQARQLAAARGCGGRPWKPPRAQVANTTPRP